MNVQIKQLEYKIDHLKTTQVSQKSIDKISVIRQIVEDLQKSTSDHHQQQQHDISSNIILTHKFQQQAMAILGEPLYEMTIDTQIQVARIIEECESLHKRSHSTALGNKRSESPNTILLTKLSPRAIQNLLVAT